jgi:tetratricopeptide (TPR) repeat protein
MSATILRALSGALLGVSLGTATALAQGGDGPRDTTVTYVEQPAGIDLADYVAAWPALAPYVARLRQGGRDAVRGDLQRLAESASPPDGALNLLAQLEREDGRLDEARVFIERAIAASPGQHLHYFQQAMVAFAQLSRASGLGRWTWQRRTRDAYQRAFDIDPRPVPYRFYLAYTLVQTPGIAGGDKDRALRMADEGVGMGQKAFYVVRADVHRFRGERALAFADYDRAIEARVFKLNAFLAAGDLAAEQQDWPRARRYFEWAVHCRPDSEAARARLAALPGQ